MLWPHLLVSRLRRFLGGLGRHGKDTLAVVVIPAVELYDAKDRIGGS